MKEALGALLVGLVLGVSVPWLFFGRAAFKAQPSEKDQPRKPAERRTNGQGFVKLDHPRQVSAGIVSANPQAVQLAAEVEAYGRVPDSKGVGPSDRIVVSGAQVLLSERLKSQIGFPE